MYLWLASLGVIISRSIRAFDRHYLNSFLWLSNILLHVYV